MATVKFLNHVGKGVSIAEGVVVIDAGYYPGGVGDWVLTRPSNDSGVTTSNWHHAELGMTSTAPGRPNSPPVSDLL